MLKVTQNKKRGELNQDNKELKTYKALSFGIGVVTSKLEVDDSIPPS